MPLSWRKVGAAARVTFLLVVIGQLATGLQAQGPARATDIPDLSAIWTRSGRVVAPAVLPLNARAFALRAAFDESLSPMYDCVPATVPIILGDPYDFQIEQQRDRVIIRFESHGVVRTVWLDGFGHPKPANHHYAVNGYSTGRYEGRQLVVETTKYTFDPAGIYDDPPMVPSSTQKKTTERYSRDGDRLTVDVTMEDPLMLTAPFKLSYAFQRTQKTLEPWLDCDPVQARAPFNYVPVDQLKYGIR